MIREIKWHNHKILGNLELNFTKPDGTPYNTIVLAGENGVGKTTILETLATFLNLETMEPFEYIKYIVDGIPYTISPEGDLGKYGFHSRKNETSDEMQTIHSGRDNNRARIEEDTADLRHYGFSYSKARSGFNTGKIKSTTTQQLDSQKYENDSKEDFTLIKQLIVDINAQDNSEWMRLTRAGSSTTFNEFEHCSKMFRFEKAFNDFFDIVRFKGIDDTNKEEIKILFEKHGKDISVDSLSTGEKQVVFRGAHLLKNSNSMVGGVVLLDEPELSMHPKWQQKVLEYIENAATGLWTFIEIDAPSGFCVDPTPKSVYVDASEGDREYTVAAVNYAMPSMILYKEDAQTSAPVPGTVLSVKSVTGAYSTSVKIGESGSATLEGLEPGVYVVSEESVPEPYILSHTEQTVALRPGKTTEVHFQNYKKPGLEILKKNIANMDPIPDMTYKVEQIDGSFETTVTTDLRGRAYLENIPVGSYRISEVGGPSNVILSEIPQVIYLEAGCTRTVTFFNAIKPTLTVLKQNSVTSDPLPSAKLHIYYASDNTSTGEMHDLGVFYSNEEGKVVLVDAERGWYKIVEESCPQGFGYLDGEAVQEFYLEENTSKTVIIRNVPLSALVGFKYDSKTGKGIPGCRFELRYLSGNTSGTGGTVIGTYVTGPNGAFTVTGLKKGTYICEEVSSDGSHIIDSEPQTVWISGEDQDVVIIRFGNSPFGSLLVTKLSDDNKRSPIPNTDFLLTYSDGTFVGNDNGIYTTNAAGEILVDGLEPGVTIIAREVRAAAGFLLDESPQHIQIKSGETVHLQFLNRPFGNLIIKKNSSAPTQEAVPGAEFEITYADGSYVDAAGGTISSNGHYVTDEHGEIRISGIVGTVVVTEIKSGPGYQLDEANRTQTVTINPGDTQTIQFYNAPISKVEFIKVDEANRSVRIPDTTIEVRRLDGALVTTLVTSESGQAFAQLEDGSYYAVETVANPKYQLDSTPVYFEVKDGKCAPVVLTNKMICGILIHKTSSTTDEGIYGVPFILYDGNHNPIAQEESDNEGYVRFEGLSAGRFYLRELENEGYVPDAQEKTVYVKDGETTLVEWQNTPITGQIQVLKTSEDYNSMNGWPAGTPIPDTELEIYNARTNRLVDTIKADKNGLAVSKPLPLGRYKIVESKAGKFYGLDKTPIEVEIEYVGQIVKVSMTNRSLSTNVSIKKTGPSQAVSGQPIRYVFSQIKNGSNVSLDSFYWRDQIPAQITLNKIVTGSYNQQQNYKVVYKTNLSEDYRTLADNLSTSKVYVLDARPAVLSLAANERVTEIMFVFGNVRAGFAQVETPYIYATARSGLANNSSIVNVADVGGLYDGQWIQAVSRWLTTIYAKTTVRLPKTGY